MSVIRPPSSVEKASGIRSLDAGIRVRRETSTTTGSIRAATPILFMNADSTAPVIMMTTIIATSRRPAMRMTWRPMMSAMPVRVSPSLRMNIAQTVITALLEKPANAWLESTRPVTARAPSTSNATRSIRMISLMNRISEIARIPSTSAISSVMLQ